jgi:hypothetical protein
MNQLIRNESASAVLDELVEPLERRIIGPYARVDKVPPPAPLLTSYPAASLELRYTDRGTTLTAAHYSHDPLVAHEGVLRAPKSELKKLRKLERAGLDPDLVWVLRELPGTWRPGELPPRMIATETAATARTRELLHLQAAAAAFVFGRALLYTAAAALTVAAGAAVALGSISIAAAGAIATTPLGQGLDPIILAGVAHPRQPAVAWVAISAWDEIEDSRGW